MKICKNEKEFIEYVAPIAQKVCKRYGFKPSILIAQTFHENGAAVPSNFDNSGIYDLMKYNNMVGQKAKLLNDTWSDYSVWPGIKPGKFEEYSFYKETPEEYGGRMTTITDAFRKFDSVEQSLADYILFLLYAKDSVNARSYRYGPDVVNIQDPYELIKAVGKKYATGSSYAENVYDVVKRYNLTKYDDLTNVKPTDIVPDILKKSTSKISTTKKATTTSNVKKLSDRKINDITAENRGQVPASRGGNSIQFIVVHYLGVPNADNPYLYGGGYGGHYNIQRDGQIFKAANPKTAVVWHCGGGLQGSGGHQFHRICTNYNSIGIECGVCYTENIKNADGDSNKWYFTEETQESLVYLVSNLMDEYGISMDHVIRHYDVTGKICPNPYVKNNNLRTSWTWNQFKANLTQYRKNGTITVPNGSSSSSSSSTKSYLSKGDSGNDVKKLQTMLNACGYNCGTVDSDFGSKTEKALRTFQSDHKLAVDGLYGPKSKSALETVYKALSTTNQVTTSATTFLNAIKAVADQARSEKWTYGNSTSTPPCADKKISCDRLIARALYNLGYTDQPKGGIVCGKSIDEHLQKWGFTKVTNKSKIKSGAVVAVKNKNQTYVNHVFVVKTYNPTTDKCDKYDTGSNTRIKTVQPFNNVKLVEWPDREFVCAWNVPNNLKTNNNNNNNNNNTQTSNYIYNGVDYSLVYNDTYYKKKYIDLQKAFGNNKSEYFKHFCQYGMKEARQGSANFNVLKYKQRYSDLQKAFGENLPLYYKHYCQYGKKENRKAT